MAGVIDRLFVGDEEIYKRLRGREGWSFLRACKNGVDSHRDLLGYTELSAPKGPNYLWVRKGNVLALNIIDIDDVNYIPEQMIEHGVKFVAERHQAGDKVLIACNQGHSRGPTIAMLYMHSIGELPHSFIQAERIFKTLYPKYDPNLGMRKFARLHWHEYEKEK